MSGLLFLAPALLLALALALRRYPGERRLLALAGARRRHSMPRPRTVLAAVGHRPPSALSPRGRMLLAFALATRPPPAALST